MWQRKILSVCLFSAFFSLLFGSSVLAVSGSETFSVVQNWNTYYDGNDWHQSAYDGTVSIPHQILGSPSSGRKYVSWSRFRLGMSERGSTTNQFNVITVKLTIIGGNIFGTSALTPVGTFFQSSGSDIVASCNYTNVSSSGLEIVCSATLGRGSLFTGFDIKTSNSDAISTDYYGLTTASTSTIRLTQILVSWDGTEDPNTALLEGISGDTQTIIEQNSEINDNLENINDSLTDSTVTGSFNVSNVPSFGPVATIVNNLIGLVQDFLTIGSTSCSPLEPPLPNYAGGGTLTIACPSTFLSPFRQFTTAVDAIIAAYLWVKIAIYIYHKVSDLRNPENDDEEFLDL